MALSPEPTSRPNPRRRTSRRRHFHGLDDEQRRNVVQRQRDAIVAIFDAMEDYFCAELDAQLESLDSVLTQPEPAIEADFADDPEVQ